MEDAYTGGVVPRPITKGREVIPRLEDQIRKILIEFPQPEQFTESANGDLVHARIICQRLMLMSVLQAVSDSQALSLDQLPQIARNSTEQAKFEKTAKKNLGFFAEAASALASDFHLLSNGISPRSILKPSSAQDRNATLRAKARVTVLQAMVLVAMPGQWGKEEERIAFAAKASGLEHGTLRTRIRNWNKDKKEIGDGSYVPKFSDFERQIFSELEEKFRKLGAEYPPRARARFWAMVMFGRIMPEIQR
jgi:hypothetical protein